MCVTEKILKSDMHKNGKWLFRKHTSCDGDGDSDGDDDGDDDGGGDSDGEVEVDGESEGEDEGKGDGDGDGDGEGSVGIDESLKEKQTSRLYHKIKLLQYYTW